MSFLVDVLEIVVGVVAADTIMKHSDKIEKAATYVRGEATIIAAQVKAKAAAR